MKRILRTAQQPGALAAEVEVMMTFVIITMGFIGLVSLFPVTGESLVPSDHQTHTAVLTGAGPELARTELSINESSRGSVSGSVRWGGFKREEPKARQQLFLRGIEGPSLGRFYEVRTDGAGHYRFVGVAPGTYALTNRTDGRPIWTLKVVVEAGKEKEVNLTFQNSVTVTGDYTAG